LLQSFDRAEELGLVHVARLCAPDEQPCTLGEECQQEKSCENLWAAETFAGKKFTHEGTASVLPCPGTIGKLPRWMT
jgi:hypothetical protein